MLEALKSKYIELHGNIKPGDNTAHIGEQMLRHFEHGDLYSFVVTKCARFLPPFYKDLKFELEHRRFPTFTKQSYANIPEYYTKPLNAPHIDRGPTDPYARFASKDPSLTGDITPELLLEPFDDLPARSSNTITEMIDMFSKKMYFEIIRDKDVITIYLKVDQFLKNARNIRYTNAQKDYVDYLNKMLEFKQELEPLYIRNCKRLNVHYNEHGLMDIIAKQLKR